MPPRSLIKCSPGAMRIEHKALYFLYVTIYRHSYINKSHVHHSTYKIQSNLLKRHSIRGTPHLRGHFFKIPRVSSFGFHCIQFFFMHLEKLLVICTIIKPIRYFLNCNIFVAFAQNCVKIL